VKWSDIERRYEEERGQQMMEETGKDEAQQRVKWSDIERRYEEERGQQMMRKHCLESLKVNNAKR